MDDGPFPGDSRWQSWLDWVLSQVRVRDTCTTGCSDRARHAGASHTRSPSLFDTPDTWSSPGTDTSTAAHPCETTLKVIRNPLPHPDHRKKSITSRGSTLVHGCRVWSMSVFAFVSYPVYRMTDGIRIRIFGLIRIRMSVRSIPKCLDGLSCRRQSFCQVWYKSAVWEMLMFKNPLFRNVEENEKVRIRITTKS